MKHNPLENEIRARMEPGVLSRDGFLGRDNRNIEDIVDADRAALEKADLAIDDIADLLDEIHAAMEGTMGTRRELYGGRISARLEEGMGGIPCPFGCGHIGHKGVLTIDMPDRQLTITPLHGHLVRRHGFFQGKGAAFRLEPRDVIALYKLCRGEG
jgi:hypothetical protein